MVNYVVLVIREISFIFLNVFDNYYYLDIIKDKKVVVSFLRVILNVE